jgi:hypothetical protein
VRSRRAAGGEPRCASNATRTVERWNVRPLRLIDSGTGAGTPAAGLAAEHYFLEHPGEAVRTVQARAKDLDSGIAILVCDPAVFDAVMQHPAMTALGNTNAETTFLRALAGHGRSCGFFAALRMTSNRSRVIGHSTTTRLVQVLATTPSGKTSETATDRRTSEQDDLRQQQCERLPGSV